MMPFLTLGFSGPNGNYFSFYSVSARYTASEKNSSFSGSPETKIVSQKWQNKLMKQVLFLLENNLHIYKFPVNY